MKIGLVRHFKVKQAFPGKFLIHYDELVQWYENYEVADIEQKAVYLREVNWDKCYSSSTPRALKTAEHIFQGDILKRDELKELNILPLMKNSSKLPFIVWGISIRNKSLSSNRLTDEFMLKISVFIDKLLSEGNKNILIVSHGFTIMYIQKELIKRGFKGDKFGHPSNGKVYLFEK